ncbi:MAG: hypothetical protein ACKVUT_01945 [Gaiella sp.]
MTEHELTRTSGDRRLYSLEGIGTVRLEGLFSNRATAVAAGSSWRINRRGFWQREIEATDAAGAVVGELVPRDIRRGGRLRWGDHELTLRPVSPLRERYALSEDNRELVLLDGKGWGRRPVKITLTEPEAIEPGLVLFAAFVVHRLAANSSGSTAAISSSSSGGYLS